MANDPVGSFFLVFELVGAFWIVFSAVLLRKIKRHKAEIPGYLQAPANRADLLDELRTLNGALLPFKSKLAIVTRVCFRSNASLAFCETCWLILRGKLIPSARVWCWLALFSYFILLSMMAAFFAIIAWLGAL